MKRFLPLLILLFMVGSIFAPFLQEDEEIPVEISEPIIMAELEETIITQTIEYEPDPIDIYIEEMQSKMEEINTINDKKEWYVAYKSIVNEYSDIIGEPDSIYDCLTEDEIYLIQRVIETECYGGEFDSKVNVANVILNRIDDSETFGDGAIAVVTAPNQFTYQRSDISEDTVLALEYAFQMEDTTNGSVAFRSDSKPEKWHKWEYVFSDNAVHHFYKLMEE